ncbi:unnamed protein product [Cylicocyclus nassatus]|uniref:Protein lifeguard 1 n=1 Tax=Cylicocyclus nassatus TaxID=53992 RepID=A0AA36DQK3_CYLNA|nr:unnamed protein product [Cylicocyclus nassatus]
MSPINHFPKDNFFMVFLKFVRATDVDNRLCDQLRDSFTRFFRSGGRTNMETQPTAPPAGEEDAKYSLQFSDQSIRSRFVAKVFTLVTIMFIVVTIMCAMPFIFPPFKRWIQQNWVFFLVSICVFIVTSIVLLCCSSVRRSYPANLITLGIFTLASGYMTMSTTSFYNVESVLLALCITTGVSAAIVVFAIYIKKDLTTLIGIVYILGMTMLFFGITATISVLAFRVTFLYTVYAVLGALLSMLYLAIDIQLIMGGRRFELSPEEYIFASMQIFLDILNIFLFMLRIFGSR